MDIEDQRDTIIKQLEVLNLQVARQNSLSRMFVVGVIYGIGFFVGSAVIATIALGILGPLVGQVAWIRSAFTTGLSLLH